MGGILLLLVALLWLGSRSIGASRLHGDYKYQGVRKQLAASSSIEQAQHLPDDNNGVSLAVIPLGSNESRSIYIRTTPTAFVEEGSVSMVASHSPFSTRSKPFKLSAKSLFSSHKKQSKKGGYPRPTLCKDACRAMSRGEVGESIGSGTTSIGVYMHAGFVIKAMGRSARSQEWEHECVVGQRINSFSDEFASHSKYAHFVRTQCCLKCKQPVDVLIIGLDVAPGEEFGNILLKSKETDTATNAHMQHRISNIKSKLTHTLNDAWTKHKLVHNDVNFGNVMVTDDGKVTLFDYGYSGFDLPHLRNDVNACVLDMEADTCCKTTECAADMHQRDLEMFDLQLSLLA